MKMKSASVLGTHCHSWVREGAGEQKAKHPAYDLHVCIGESIFILENNFYLN